MPEAIRILFTIPNFITAGSGGAMLNIIERLDRDRFSCGVCVSRKGGELDRRVEALGIPFHELPFTVPPRPYHSLILRAWRAAEAFRGKPYDLWHSFHYSDDYSEPLVARCAGARAWVFTKKNMGWGSRAWSLRSLLGTRIAAQNTAMMKQFFHRYPFNRKTLLVPRGVDTVRFSQDVPRRLGLRTRLGIPEDVIIVGCVAQIVRVKGHPTLLKALTAHPSLVLLIAGASLDPEYAEELQRVTDGLGLRQRVHFLGEVRDVPAFHAEIDIAVLPTWAQWRMEGCPVALLEAMACGKACIATNIPGSQDLIVHGESGLLVPAENVDAMASMLGLLALSPARRKALGDGARRRVLEQFSIDREVRDHERLYLQALGRREG